jgi:hypothetical protein
VPLETPQNTGSEFLREFNFSTGLVSCLKRVFGATGKPSWLEIRLHHEGKDPYLLRQKFVLEIKTVPPAHSVWAHSTQLPCPSGGELGIEIPPFHHEYGIGIPESDIANSYASLPDFLFQQIEVILYEAAPAFYECDPRLGFTLKSEKDQLPESKFFDPRTGLPFPRGFQQFFAKYVDMAYRQCPESIPEWQQINCTLCNKEFHPFDPPMWAGGNVLWVHRECWGDA